MKRTLEWILFWSVAVGACLVAANAPAASVSFQNFNPAQFQATAAAPGYVGITNGASITNLNVGGGLQLNGSFGTNTQIPVTSGTTASWENNAYSNIMVLTNGCNIPSPITTYPLLSISGGNNFSVAAANVVYYVAGVNGANQKPPTATIFTGTASGSFDVGIYDQFGNLICHTGAVTGTNSTYNCYPLIYVQNYVPQGPIFEAITATSLAATFFSLPSTGIQSLGNSLPAGYTGGANATVMIGSWGSSSGGVLPNSVAGNTQTPLGLNFFSGAFH